MNLISIAVFALLFSGCCGVNEKRIKRLESRIIELEAEIALINSTPETSHVNESEDTNGF